MTVTKNKEFYEALLEAGASTDKAASAAMSLTPYHSELKQKLIELKNGITFLKLSVLLIIVLETLQY